MWLTTNYHIKKKKVEPEPGDGLLEIFIDELTPSDACVNFKVPQRAENDRAETEGRLLEMTTKWTQESRQLEEFRSRLEAADRDARFKMNILEGQLRVERELTLRKSQMQISAVNQKFKGEYDTR